MGKYIDIDRLKAEIEKRLKNVRDYMNGTGVRYKGPKYFKAQGKESAYDTLLNILDNLQKEQPSLPSNLDDASKKIVIQLHPCMEHSSVLGDHLTMGELVELVKAGANWQKEQDESRRIANIQLANTDTPIDTEMEVAFNDIWRDAEVIVERDGTLDEKATELMKAVCHDFFESGKEWQKERMGEQARKELAKTDITLADLVAFDEGLKLGRRLERQDMLKDAAMVEGEVVELGETYKSLAFTVGLEELNAVLQPLGVKDGDKVKMVVVPIKED